jgi:putative membrane protein
LPAHFLTDETKAAFARAVQAVEAESGAEVVISVRGRSGDYLHVGPWFGALAAVVMLAVVVFSPFEFSGLWIFVDPILVGALFGWLGARTDAVRRALTPRRVRDRWVADAARAAFFERGVRQTSGRTGVLVYLSLLERRAVILADSGCAAELPSGPWAEATARVDAAMARRSGGPEVALAIEGLGPLLAEAVPRSHDDINELPDEVHS